MAFKKEEEKEMKGNKMKKLLSLLAILAIAMPSMAGITVDVAVEGKTAVITYTADTDDEPCALALDITPVNTGDAIDGYTPGDSFFDVFIDHASDVVNSGGTYSVGSGTPFAAVASAGAIAAPTTQAPVTDAFCISLAGLEDDGTDIAPASATIITLEGAGTFTIGVNAIRGGVVKADSAAPAVDVTFTVTEDSTTTATNTFTLASAAPVCVGDADGNGYIYTDDLTALVSYLTQFASNYYYVDGSDPLYNPNMDIDQNGYVYTDDLTAMITVLNGLAANYYYAPCP